MGNDKPSIEALRKLLNEINSSLGDFSERPATSATDTSVSGDTPLHKVAVWGDVEAAEVLLRSGADINAIGEDQDTPLHRAIAGGNLEMIRYLIREGANPVIPNRYGTTPLGEAEGSGSSELVAALRSQSRPTT